MEEVYKLMGLYPGYAVSNCGNVKSLKRGNVLRHQNSGRGYRKVSMSINGVVHQQPVHRLVALAFIPNPLNKPTVNHQDGVKTNNIVTNLNWATYVEQEQHAKAMGLKTYDHNKGKKHVRAKGIKRSDGKVYGCVMDAARDIGIPNGATFHLLQCANGVNKTAYGFKWAWVTQ